MPRKKQAEPSPPSPEQRQAHAAMGRQLLEARGAVPYVHPRRLATTAEESLAIYDGIDQDVTAVVGVRNRAQKMADLFRAALVRAGAREKGTLPGSLD